MISLQLAADQISGVLRLAFTPAGELADGDPAAQSGVRQSVDDFFASFWAIVFALPFFAIGVLAARRTILATPALAEAAPLAAAHPVFYLAVNVVGFVIDWALSIVGIAAIARASDVSGKIASAIICYNWAQVLTTAIQAVPTMLIGFFGAALGLLSLPALAVSIFILWAIFRKALGASVSTTVAILILLIAITLASNAVVAGAATWALQALYPSAG